MSWYQKEIVVIAHERGFSVITNQILQKLPEISQIDIGTLHLFIKHTSASLTINENADTTVRSDMESHFNVIAPENAHTDSNLSQQHSNRLCIPIEHQHLACPCSVIGHGSGAGFVPLC